MTHTPSQPPIASDSLTADSVTSWVTGYLRAWTSNDREDIAALFTEDAEYHEAPFDTEWIGRQEIIEGWTSRWDWQQGGWTFDWTLASIHGSTAVITGVGHYTELGDFDNLWTVTFDESARCTRFEMVNTERA